VRLKRLIRDERGMIAWWLAALLLGAVAASIAGLGAKKPTETPVDDQGFPVNVQPVMPAKPAAPAPAAQPKSGCEAMGGFTLLASSCDSSTDPGPAVQGQVPSGGSSIDTSNQQRPGDPVVVVTNGGDGTGDGSNSSSNGGSTSSSNSSSSSSGGSSNGCQSMGGYYLASGDMGGGSGCGGTSGGG
jgi:hypothetical protein